EGSPLSIRAVLGAERIEHGGLEFFPLVVGHVMNIADTVLFCERQFLRVKLSLVTRFGVRKPSVNAGLAQSLLLVDSAARTPGTFPFLLAPTVVVHHKNFVLEVSAVTEFSTKSETARVRLESTNYD